MGTDGRVGPSKEGLSTVVSGVTFAGEERD
jgi:hypothetical protein